MTNYVTIPLRSLELADRCLAVPCLVCDQQNSNDAPICRYCQAPLFLAHQTRESVSVPRMLGILGAPQSGKTVYLGVLADMLSRHTDPKLQIMARGAQSVSVQQTTISALRDCHFPAATEEQPSSWNWLHCHVRGRALRQPVELILPDLSGTALARELGADTGCLATRSILNKSVGILLLLDAAAVRAGKPDEVFFALRALSYLCELNGQGLRRWPRPLGIVLTKADGVMSGVEAPEEFLERYAPALWKACRERLTEFHVFATSIVGALAYRQDGPDYIPIPLRIEPRGVIEPFEWVVGQISRASRSRLGNWWRPTRWLRRRRD